MSDAGLRVGVYVDAENLSRNGGERMQHRVLRSIACREGGQANLRREADYLLSGYLIPGLVTALG